MAGNTVKYSVTSLRKAFNPFATRWMTENGSRVRPLSLSTLFLALHTIFHVKIGIFYLLLDIFRMQNVITGFPNGRLISLVDLTPKATVHLTICAFSVTAHSLTFNTTTAVQTDAFPFEKKGEKKKARKYS